MVELIGILAGILVLLSFVLTGERKIRMVNIFGAVLFVIYGMSIDALSIWLLNGILVFVQLYYLVKMKPTPDGEYIS
ncbi:hypothetical protein AC622_15870 [Bacillus sp. FJAT-27916]|uniref:hypothetical protein n=1 Tax=Bacillaceae TaxID=186817 RepID=UPI000670FD9F|nr:hypothetical protein [Bacillus sp. FJAT-27916]KMY45519.1 hypothetical protein AC622_15870 [Bacillus sp. FJAT-27916]